MQRNFSLAIFTAILFLSFIKVTLANDFIVYSISQDFPMGTKDEKIKKNYYVNIGSQQGVASGTVLDVYRNISRPDPFNSNKQYNYEVKIGELKVIHTEDDSSITLSQNFINNENTPLLDLNDFMVGDEVRVKIK